MAGLLAVGLVAFEIVDGGPHGLASPLLGADRVNRIAILGNQWYTCQGRKSCRCPGTRSWRSVTVISDSPVNGKKRATRTVAKWPWPKKRLFRRVFPSTRP